MMFKEKLEELKEGKNLILKGFGGEMTPTVENITNMIQEIKPDLTIVDNFDLIVKESSISEYSEQNRIANQFMDFCHNTLNPVIMIHHLNPKNKNSGISALRGSGKIADDCDMAIS